MVYSLPPNVTVWPRRKPASRQSTPTPPTVAVRRPTTPLSASAIDAGPLTVMCR
jgi:hypothetical protein